MNNEIKLPGAYGRSFGSRGKLQELDGVCDTLVAAMGSGGGNVPIIQEEEMNNDVKIKVVGNYSPSNHDASRIVCGDGLAPTVKENHGTVTAVLLGEKENPKFTKNKNVDLNVYREMAIESGCELPCAVDEQNVNIRKDGTVGTLTTNGSSAKRNNRVMETSFRIRKLTPKECFRLMGFDDESFHKAEKVNSNTQLYKQAGNSIVVPVLEGILGNLQECGVL